jgi:hypothetical protein
LDEKQSEGKRFAPHHEAIPLGKSLKTSVDKVEKKKICDPAGN